jgi:hypothetical protein
VDDAPNDEFLVSGVHPWAGPASVTLHGQFSVDKSSEHLPEPRSVVDLAGPVLELKERLPGSLRSPVVLTPDHVAGFIDDLHESTG